MRMMYKNILGIEKSARGVAMLYTGVRYVYAG